MYRFQVCILITFGKCVHNDNQAMDCCHYLPKFPLALTNKSPSPPPPPQQLLICFLITLVMLFNLNGITPTIILFPLLYLSDHHGGPVTSLTSSPWPCTFSVTPSLCWGKLLDRTVTLVPLFPSGSPAEVPGNNRHPPFSWHDFPGRNNTSFSRLFSQEAFH